MAFIIVSASRLAVKLSSAIGASVLAGAVLFDLPAALANDPEDNWLATWGAGQQKPRRLS